MERKTIDTLISGLIICMFFILGILYQFSIIAMHYVFGYITYVIIAIAFIISFLSNVELRKRIICLIVSVITLITAIGTHFILINNPYVYRYEKVENGIKITDYVYKIFNNYDSKQYNLEIPSKINNKDVKVIGRSAFKNHEFNTVIIPDTVEIIEDYAFYGTYTRNVYLSRNLRIIGNYAFENCMLEELYLPDKVEEIGKYAFSMFDLIKFDYINIPSSVKSIGLLAFRDFDVICIEENSVYNNGEYLFYTDGCSVYYNSIAYLYNDIIYALHDDFSATIAHARTNIIDGNIIDKITYEGNDYNVTTIGKYAFEYTEIVDMVIPNTITKIGAYAFSNCDQLRNIYIPSSVTEVGMSILYKCLNVNIYIEHLEIPDGWYRLWNDKIDGYKIKYGPYNS